MSGVFVNTGSLSRYNGEIQSLSRALAPSVFSASYLAVAGGGGGGSGQGGGGGAGQFIPGTVSITRGVTYTVTVGSGGAGGPAQAADPGVRGINGGDTAFSAIVALGGGGGGGGAAAAASTTGLDGGSGGGGGGRGGKAGGAAIGATGGFAGGTSRLGDSSATSAGGGGGGAGAVGASRGSTTNDPLFGAGGVGLSSSITGTAVVYAGGGGGGSINTTGGGTGGTGGGGTGGGGIGAGTNGAVNTGGGGGGGGRGAAPVAGGNGGSGIFILAIPTAQYNAVTTGPTTVSISGSNTILTFTDSGTVVFPNSPVPTPVFQGVSAAYSVRIPQGSTYSGPLMRVRRSSDNAEQDILAVPTLDANGNRWLDTTALLAFVGTGSGFVTTWYDQSGNGYHAVQATTGLQPAIVNAGVLYTFNSVPTIFSDSKLLLSPSIPILGGANTALTLTGVLRTGTLASYKQWWGIGVTAAPYYGLDVCANSSATRLYVGTNAQINDTGPAIASNTPYVMSALYNGSAGTPALNGVLGNSLSFACNMGTGAINLGGSRATASTFSGSLSELCVFAGASAPTQRQTLERSQGAAFGITVI